MKYSIKKQIDFHIDFEKWYFKIINDLNFDYQKDLVARDFLSSILREKTDEWRLEEILLSFYQSIQNKKCIFIYGCGPSLEETVNYILKVQEKNIFNNAVNLVADGAARLMIKKRIPINAIFTDLDGITKAEFDKSEFIIVHAHGDNIARLKYFKNEILNFRNVIGTTQVKPVENLVNSGGFTDGDRILFFIASLLNPKHELFLIGMDFNKIVGKYSKLEINRNHVADSIKLKKLQYGLKVIEWLLPQIKNPVYIVNSKIDNVSLKYLTLEKFRTMMLER
ncbi:MAG: 6-hydroxymethylpterin diphosphokinase MptE-like protein [Candidatus Thorarchaeota archaeon]